MINVIKQANSVAIVHSRKNPATCKIDRRTLYTIHSKAEALEIVGKGRQTMDTYFASLLEQRYPEINFNWIKVHEGIIAQMDVLPDLFDYKKVILTKPFEGALTSFMKEICLLNPQDSISAATVIQDYQYQLEFLNELLQWRLDTRNQQRDKWNQDDAFFWRYALRSKGVPPEVEEMAETYFNKKDFERAEAIFRLLISCFDGYAEGHNYLGLIALEQYRLDEAVELFRKTSEIGRLLFPPKMDRESYWNVLSTRPYMRGLRNLAIALNQSGQYEQAIGICERLEKECGDETSSICYKASIHLNTGSWQLAANEALSLVSVYPEMSLLESYALFELGQRMESFASFLHAAMNRPRTVCILTNIRMNQPREFLEIEDHNAGVSLSRSLKGFFSRQSRSSIKFYKTMANIPEVFINFVISESSKINAKGKRQVVSKMIAQLKDASREAARKEAERILASNAKIQKLIEG
ncbi:MAG TPA: hypothetical protein VM658_13700 [bacterium]|nr:hypothetical protein [bacterium]